MGEAPALSMDDLQMEPSNGVPLKSKESKTTVIVGNKMYVIGVTCNVSTTSIEVQIFDRSNGKWIIHVMLETKPKLSKGHSLVFLNNDDMLVVKAGSSPYDIIWFLEVDTKFVREQKKRYESEVVAWSKGVIGEVEKPVVISGPSGVGKGTLITKLVKEFPSMFGFFVSHMTPSSREKEIDGVHYHLSERNAMEKDIKDGKFLEFASVHGNLYGTSVEAVEVVADEGKRFIFIGKQHEDGLNFRYYNIEKGFRRIGLLVADVCFQSNNEELVAVIDPFITTEYMVVVSPAFVIHKSANPHIGVLSRLLDATIYMNALQYPEAYTNNGIVIVRIDASIFANIIHINNTLWEYEFEVDKYIMDPKLRDFIL